MAKRKIFALSGSTRELSVNFNLIKAIQSLFASELVIELYQELSVLPQFNPDLGGENEPGSVVVLKQKLRAADGILICTPEYAMGVPGSLKNAIDWTVSSGEFSRKIVAVITASTSGEKAHASLLETLNVLEGRMAGQSGLLIPFAASKINRQFEITDPATQQAVISLINSFIKMIDDQQLR